LILAILQGIEALGIALGLRELRARVEEALDSLALFLSPR
jgi:hypothetical protein